MAIIRGKYSRIKLKTCFKLSTNATYDASSAISDPFNVHANPPTMLSAPILISTCSAVSKVPIKVVCAQSMLFRFFAPSSRAFIKMVLHSMETHSGPYTGLLFGFLHSAPNLLSIK